jgi:hypothetical protein
MNDPMYLRIWHVPQVPMKPFRVSVPDVATGRLINTVLANYDRFQLENKVKPDYCNAQGIERLVSDDWEEIDDENDAYDGMPLRIFYRTRPAKDVGLPVCFGAERLGSIARAWGIPSSFEPARDQRGRPRAR